MEGGKGIVFLMDAARRAVKLFGGASPFLVCSRVGASGLLRLVFSPAPGSPRLSLLVAVAAHL